MDDQMKKFGLSDVLARFYLSHKPEPDSPAPVILLADIQEMIHHAKDKRPQLQYIEKTFKGDKFHLISKDYTQLIFLKQMVEWCKRLNFFEVYLWNRCIPVLTCNLDAAMIVNNFKTYKNDYVWFRDNDQIDAEEMRDYYEYFLIRFTNLNGDEINGLQEYYNRLIDAAFHAPNQMYRKVLEEINPVCSPVPFGKKKAETSSYYGQMVV